MDISWLPKSIQNKLQGKGLGDVVKEFIDTASAGKIKQCEGCKRRQQMMNNALKFESRGEQKCLPCEEKRKIIEQRLKEKTNGSRD